MALSKDSEFDPAGALDGTEVVAVLKGGLNRRTTSGAIAGLGGGGGGSMPGAGYAQYLASLLEPDAIEALQAGTFSYAVGSGVTKMLLASWATRLGSSGRMEQRNPQRAMSLRNCTLAGLGGGSAAVILDPAAVTYADPWATYYDRLQQIAELDVKTISLTATSQRKPFLPGPYGAIITQVTCFEFAWIIWRIHGTYGPNLWDEISDSSTQRIGDSLTLPISKRVAGEFESSSAGSSPLGSVSYVLLPSTWSEVPDPVSASYTFRDDFMDTALDAGVWTRAQSTAGNVEIDTQYQWCKVRGSAAWGTNGLYRTAATTRANGVSMVVDVFAPRGSTANGAGAIGWSNGGGHSNTNLSHGVNFGGSNNFQIIENGTVRATLSTAWSEGSIYRFRLTLSGAGCVYEVQGGSEYPAIGSASWTNITPGTSSSADNSLHPAATTWGAVDVYISDMREF